MNADTVCCLMSSLCSGEMQKWTQVGIDPELHWNNRKVILENSYLFKFSASTHEHAEIDLVPHVG